MTPKPSRNHTTNTKQNPYYHHQSSKLHALRTTSKHQLQIKPPPPLSSARKTLQVYRNTLYSQAPSFAISSIETPPILKTAPSSHSLVYVHSTGFSCRNIFPFHPQYQELRESKDNISKLHHASVKTHRQRYLLDPFLRIKTKYTTPTVIQKRTILYTG